MIINLQQHKRQKCANELAFLASLLDDNRTKDLINELSGQMSEREEIEYLCIKQNKQASKAIL